MSDANKDPELSRREMMKVAATSLLVGALPLTTSLASAEPIADASKNKPVKSKKPKITYTFLNKREVAFIEAAIARLIPADEKWGGALEAGVSNYIDKQLGGSWGAGERLYRSGPWQPGTKSQGYQLPYTPAELFRTALRAIDKELAAKKTPFEKMKSADQDAYLKGLDSEERELDGVPSKIFFSSLWQITQEGFFSDPVYGGNQDMISWRMIGFPGAYGSYYDIVEKHGIKITRAPISLAEDPMGHVHPNPNIPAR